MKIDFSQDLPFGHLAREMSRFLDRMGKSQSTFYPGEAWHPNVNVYETDVAYLVCVELSGVEKDSVELTVAENRLSLRGRRDVPRCPAQITDCDGPHTRAKIHVLEIDHGPFQRDVELPTDIASAKITAAYRNGLLWIEVPKTVASGQ